MAPDRGFFGALRIGTLAASVILLPAAVRAGTNQWTSIGPFGAGGNVRAIAVDPQAVTTLYAGTDGGIFKSVDGGTSWGAVNNGLTGFNVYALAVDPAASGTVYAGTNAGVFKTDNGGNFWTSQRTGMGKLVVQALVIDPSNTSVVYGGTALGGVFRSTDGAATWSAASGGLANQDVRSIVIDPSATSTVYAGTGAGVYKSMDAGITWDVTPGFTNGVRTLAIDGTTPSTLYAGAEGIFTTAGVFKTTNGAASWSPSNFGLGNVPVLSIAVSQTTPAVLFAGTQGGGVFLSRDFAATWTFLDGSPATANVLAIGGVSPMVFAGSPTGFFRSGDQGRTWTTPAVNFTPFTVNAIAFDPSVSSTMFAGVGRPGSSGGGVFKTTNSGATWAPASGGLPDGIVDALVVDTGSPETIYAGMSAAGIYTSRDGGATWAPANAGLTTLSINSLAAGRTSVVYAGTNSGVFRSIDAGASWTAASTGLSALSVSALAVDSGASDVVYAGTPAGVFKTIDGGAHWIQASSGLSNFGILSLVVDPTNSQTVYAGTFSPVTVRSLDGSGVFRSTDAGASWFPYNSGIESFAVTALATDPTGASVYAATPAGVYRNNRGGSTWTGVNEGLSDQFVTSVAVNPSSPSTVYAGTIRNSLFQITFASGSGACTAGPSALCLNGNRFQVEVAWRATNIGTSGLGMAIPLTTDTGAFWFFTSSNVELVIKVVDGRSFNRSFWVFYGAMSDVEYTITVTDTLTAAKKTYENPQGQLASVADTSAFPDPLFSGTVRGAAKGSLGDRHAVPAAPALDRPSAAAGACVADATSLCLNANRFRVQVEWFVASTGMSGQGQAAPLSSDSGSFWFFSSGNLELNIKVVDGRVLNGHFWVFYGALSDVAYTITVTDTESGVARTYSNPQGQLASVADTAAF